MTVSAKNTNLRSYCYQSLSSEACSFEHLKKILAGTDMRKFQTCREGSPSLSAYGAIK